MHRLGVTLEKAEFEGRIFVSLSIVVLITGISYTGFAQVPATFLLVGNFIGLGFNAYQTVWYLLLAFSMLCISLLRMWAGSVLSARRVMAFRVQTDAFCTGGPYCAVRNPIYLADLLAICAFAICLPPVGLAMPVLFYWHYIRLIEYEERSLAPQFGDSYARYRTSVPCLLPSARSATRIVRAAHHLRLSPEGVRHNALYVLFIPGFIVAAISHNFVHAILIGIPGVIDWAVIHTRIGIKK